MKKILLTIIRIKNPGFHFDEKISFSILIELFLIRFQALLRGTKLLLRGKYFTLLMLGESVKFNYVSGIRLGKMVSIGDYSFLSGLGTDGLRIGDHSSIGAFSRLICSSNFQRLGIGIRIGKHVGIGEYAFIGGAGGVSIGDECIIGQYLSCHPENHEYQNLKVPIRLQGCTRKGITIGPNCWIGAKVTILDGVEIGQHCVIAAGSVVTKSFPSYSVIGGVPARILRSLREEEKNDSPARIPEHSII
ncbi:MAG: acyltransferase [Cytophagaceae bacterium]|jgi:acetyltransferase-like isoleucine patch superfamily enzyme|nr:acyltransferase [Cytophagaceae bacterium]